MMFRMGTVLTTVGGYPDEIKWLQKLLTFPMMSVEEAFNLQRTPGQVRVHRGGETATFTLYNKIVNAFPTGLVPYVQSYYPHPIEIWDETGSRYCDGLDRLSPTILDGVELRPYQLDAAYIALSRRRGVIQHPTGSGKTEVAAAILKCLGPEEFPVLFLVNTRFLLEQAAERFQKRGISDVCIYGGGSKDICQGVNVATVQGIIKGLDGGCPKVNWITENTRTLLVDEAHHTGNNSFYTVGVHLQQARNRIGLTMQLESMPGIFGPFDLHTVGVLGPVIHELSPLYLRRHGWQSNPVVFILPTYGENVVWSKWKPAYDDGIVRHVARNSMDILLAQAAYKANRKTLLFVWQKPHGLALLQSLNDDGIPAIFATGQSKVQYFRGNQLVQETWPFERIQTYVDEPGGKIVIGTSVIDEGADLPETDVLILSVGGKAFRRLRQRIGRGLRPKGGEHTVVFDHMDGHNAKLHEQAGMRQHVWQFDKMQHESISALKEFAGFEMPEYRPCYKPPVLSTSLPPVPSMVPGFNVSAPMGLG